YSYLLLPTFRTLPLLTCLYQFHKDTFYLYYFLFALKHLTLTSLEIEKMPRKSVIKTLFYKRYLLLHSIYRVLRQVEKAMYQSNPETLHLYLHFYGASLSLDFYGVDSISCFQSHLILT